MGVSDTELARMSVNELRALKEQVDDAIRVAIRRSRPSPVPVTAVAPPTIDLEQERDAWKARKSVAGLS